jgi:bacterioferritin
MTKSKSFEAVTSRVLEAITDEWYAQYQYWIGAVIIDDRNEDVIGEFVQHQGEELDHATDLAYWLKNTSGIMSIALSPEELARNKHCGYIYPRNVRRESLLDDAIRGESCAIVFYEKFIEMMNRGEYRNRDLETLLAAILEKEEEHLRDLEKL